MFENSQQTNFHELTIKYWGEYNHYSKLCENNPIMQNILQACYNKPCSIIEISTDIGASIQYVEAAVLKLCEYGLLKQTTKGYCTIIQIILKDNIEISDELNNMQKQLASVIMEFADNNYSKFQELHSSNNNDDNLKWQLCSLILYIGIMEKFQLKAELVAPVTIVGDRGFIWAEENGLTDRFGEINVCNMINDAGDVAHIIDYSNIGEKLNKYFNNNHYDDILFQIANAGEIPLDSFSKRDILDITKMSNLSLLKYSGGKISTRINVYDKNKYQHIQRFLREITSEVASQTDDITNKILEMLLNNSLSELKNQTKNIAALQMFNYVYAPAFYYIIDSKFPKVKLNNTMASFIVLK
jgi:transcription termination factor NusB